MTQLMTLAMVGGVLLLGIACETETDAEVPTEDLSVAYKLAVIDGDPGNEEAFQEVLDCIRASGIEGAETEEQIGDTLVASWEQSGQRDSLLEWAQAFC